MKKNLKKVTNFCKKNKVKIALQFCCIMSFISLLNDIERYFKIDWK